MSRVETRPMMAYRCPHGRTCDLPFPCHWLRLSKASRLLRRAVPCRTQLKSSERRGGPSRPRVPRGGGTRHAQRDGARSSPTRRRCPPGASRVPDHCDLRSDGNRCHRAAPAQSDAAFHASRRGRRDNGSYPPLRDPRRTAAVAERRISGQDPLRGPRRHHDDDLITWERPDAHPGGACRTQPRGTHRDGVEQAHAGREPTSDSLLDTYWTLEWLPERAGCERPGVVPPDLSRTAGATARNDLTAAEPA